MKQKQQHKSKSYYYILDVRLETTWERERTSEKRKKYERETIEWTIKSNERREREKTV